MSRRSTNRFNQREVARALKAARLAGENVERVEIDPASGKISVILSEARAPEAGAKAWNDATAELQKEKPTKAKTR
jgi:hypothetical protein